MNLTQFTIRGLFGRYNIALTLKDNILILVGENGSGKSTILGILHHFLTMQWQRLSEMPFDAVTATINNTNLSLSRASLKNQEGALERLRDYLGPSRFEYVRRELALAGGPSAVLMSPHVIRRVAVEVGISEDALHHLLEREYYMAERGSPQSKEVGRISEQLRAAVDQQVLFLPTYRRIERDIQYIFPKARIERDAPRFHAQLPEKVGYVELVEFGMKDVVDRFNATMARLDKSFREALTLLTVEYLRDVINGTYKKSYEGLLASAKDLLLERIVGRMDDRILPATEREKLSHLMTSIRDTGRVAPDQEVVAHYLSLLLPVHNTQQQQEESVVQLVKLCNSYLSGKKLHFNAHKFALNFSLVDENGEPVGDLSADALSSGEKQIVSLFTHMFLAGDSDGEISKRRKFFVIIDEPELSISVDWQKKFLIDIRQVPTCGGILAVTHSPFVFVDNGLNDYARSVEEFKSLAAHGQPQVAANVGAGMVAANRKSKKKGR